ncbi:sensor histidine kinase [Serratia liquefaciens]|uniref:tetrathionate respiration histidine kinase TtrS n=1 Tax=Serratia liquefaciens TaxID=614 RepID=UPI000D51350C|nr:tetrathionate respiration histidine kinase TtrS [Serratia liquefaciens]PVD45576.1 sensor histidine kinase [Serratia liquefaciens]QHT49742.1 PhnD/SsuA/transferrin family substrate-binding protein [Serratia liquefaciens]
MKRAALLLLLGSWLSSAWAEQWTIAVLALRGDAHALVQWQPLVDHLNRQFPADHFQLSPVSLSGMKEAIRSERVDFLLTNPAQYVQLDNRYPLRWLVSLRSAQPPLQGSSNVVGSVILVRSDSPITTPRQLTGKNVGAVASDAFGGYLLGYKELLSAGLNPEKDLQLHFSGYPADALLYQLRDRALDAVIVPVCLLEKMQAEGLLQAGDYRALLAKQSGQRCLTSTELYPNWSFAALNHVPDRLADELTRQLLQMNTPGLPVWGAPASSRQVNQLLQDLNIHPTQRSLWQELYLWAQQHWLLLSGIVGVMVLLGANHLWVGYLVRRRGRQLEQMHQTLRARETALARAQRLSALGEMASGFAHELNQPLAAIRHYAEGCRIRLERSDNQHELLPILEQIGQQAQRGAESIVNLRRWASKTPHDENAQWLLLRPLVEHVIQLMQIKQQHPQCRLTINIPSQSQLYSQATLLEQVLTNLLSNSLQAGAQQITLRHEADAHQHRLIVEDDGGGLSDEQLALPFVPFRSTKQEGLGLGLVICQRLLKGQGAELTLENYLASAQRQGLRVILHVPVIQKDPSHGADTSG